MAEIPSPRPVKPSPSLVVAVTLTGAPAASLRTRWDSSRRGPNRAGWPRTARRCCRSRNPRHGRSGQPRPAGHAGGARDIPAGRCRSAYRDPRPRRRRTAHRRRRGRRGRRRSGRPGPARPPRAGRRATAAGLVLGGVSVDVDADSVRGMMGIGGHVSLPPSGRPGAFEEALGNDQVQGRGDLQGLAGAAHGMDRNAEAFHQHGVVGDGGGLAGVEPEGGLGCALQGVQGRTPAVSARRGGSPRGAVPDDDLRGDRGAVASGGFHRLDRVHDRARPG